MITPAIDRSVRDRLQGVLSLHPADYSAWIGGACPVFFSF